MFRRVALSVGMVILLAQTPALAEDVILGHMFGTGAHAYFSGNYPEANDVFSRAIAGGSKDPRVYYFRGLTLLRMGDTVAAGADFQKGSELESQDVTRVYNIARSLERVQGVDRVTLEQYRVQARMALMERRAALERERYEAAREEQNRQLQKQIEAIPAPAAVKAAEKAPADAFQTGPTEAPKAEAPAAPAEPRTAEDLFGAAAKPGAKAGKEAKEGEEAPAAKSDDNPFAAPAGKKKGAKAAADDNPFAAPAAKPAEEMPAEKPAEKPAADPFAAPAAKPAAAAPAADPFAAPAAKPAEAAPAAKPAADPFAAPAAKPAAADPFAAPAAKPAEAAPAAKPAAADPFGAPAAAKPAEAAPAAKPAGKVDDPFGAPAPAAKPAAADPFGAPAAKPAEKK